MTSYGAWYALAYGQMHFKSAPSEQNKTPIPLFECSPLGFEGPGHLDNPQWLFSQISPEHRVSVNMTLHTI